jgi:membrane fusion protein, heavy metal efflux system
MTQASRSSAPSRRFFAPRRALGTALIVITACSRGAGTSGAGAPEPAGGAITMWTDSVELFLEHPALIVGAPDKFAVHLTDVTDFAPLRSGKITLRFVPQAGGTTVLVTQETPRSPGIYGPSPNFLSPGTYDLTLLVDSPQAKDSITVRGLRVYANTTEAPKDDGAEAPGIPFLKEQQWKTPGFRTAFATTGSVSGSVQASGQIIPAAGGLAEVSAPISGLIDLASLSRAPSTGQRVSRGQVLAAINPTLGEGGSAYADARARLQEAEDEYARAKRLLDVEAVPARRVHEAEIRLQAAREALAGLGGGAGSVPVRAPISGVITRRAATPGSRVEAGAELFTVIDPSMVWLNVNVPAMYASLVTPASAATFRLEGLAREYSARRVVSIGSVIDPVSRTLPVIYEVSNPDGSVKVGSNAQASIRTGARVEGVMIPTSALLDEDGRPIAYVQPSGERFEKRELTVAGIDGGRAVVTSGIKAGERVVVGAPYQVRLASLSTSVPAHGHVH